MVLAPDYSTFYAKFKYDNQANKNTLIFLCIQSGIITDISSSVINYFNIDLPSVKKGKVNINDYVHLDSEICRSEGRPLLLLNAFYLLPPLQLHPAALRPNSSTAMKFASHKYFSNSCTS